MKEAPAQLEPGERAEWPLRGDWVWWTLRRIMQGLFVVLAVVVLWFLAAFLTTMYAQGQHGSEPQREQPAGRPR